MIALLSFVGAILMIGMVAYYATNWIETKIIDWFRDR